MAYLGGSPLGLIYTHAGPLNGFTSFNSKAERNIKVDKYNMNDSKAAGRGNSIFTGSRIIRAWPGIEEYQSTIPGIPDEGDKKTYKNSETGTEYQADTRFEFDPTKAKEPVYQQRKSLHNNDVYDISLVNIIENMSNTFGSLKMADFAYLKDLGVYPNNRLMIARRYAASSTDNIIRKRKVKEIGPLATLISWVPEGTDFISFTFGEKWEEADASFKDILDQIGGDISSKFANTGSMIEGGASLVPLPGVTEIFQRKFLASMGILDEGSGSMIPSGNPNLIKEAKRRTTIGYDVAGSGLECKVSIAMTCEYEQKFISGLDPTIVWMDIISNILRFGTSPSVSYGLSSGFGATVQAFLNNPMAMVMSIVRKIKEALNGVISGVQQFLAEKLKEIREKTEALDKDKEKKADPNAPKEGDKDEKTRLEEATKATKALADSIIKKVRSFISTALRGLAYKYRVRIMGVVHALSGMSSTPWHITIGNPMRPVFCAGDMYTQDVQLTLGPTLAFNDLPSSIKVTFTLANARSWGLQEIMAKFNSGYMRSVDVQKTFYETNVTYKGTEGGNIDEDKTQVEPLGAFPFEYSYSKPVEEEKPVEEKKPEQKTEEKVPGTENKDKVVGDGSIPNNELWKSWGTPVEEKIVENPDKDKFQVQYNTDKQKTNPMEKTQLIKLPADDTGNPQIIPGDAQVDQNGNQTKAEQKDVPLSDPDLSEIEKSINESGSSYARKNANREVYYINGEKIETGVFHNTTDVPPPPTTKAAGFKPPKTDVGMIGPLDAEEAARFNAKNILFKQ